MGNRLICCSSCFSDEIVEKSSRQDLFSVNIDRQPFFDGVILNERMKKIRENFINKIRLSYNQAYFIKKKDEFLELAKSLTY